MTESEVVAYLKRCPSRELSRILYAVLPSRPEAEPEGKAYQYRLVLAQASSENVAAEHHDPPEWAPWELSVIAPPAPEYDANFPGDPFAQFGKCGSCNTEICSHVKSAVCPLCEAPVRLS